ncbi:MAG: PAS domain S-box protein [Fibrobacterales bacterium]
MNLALKEDENSLKHLIQHLHAGVVVHAADTHILLANEQASILLGLTIDQMMGKVAIDPAWCFVREDETPMPIEEYPVARVFSTQAPVQNLVVGINRPSTNDRVWVMVNAFPELNSDGQIVQAVVTFINITDRMNIEEALQESEQAFRSLFENSYIAVAYHKMVYDTTGKPVNYLFEKANECFKKLTGLNPTGKLVTEAFPGIEKDPFDYIGKYGEVAKTGKEIRFQTHLQPNDQWYDCVCYQNKLDHFVVVFLDISEQKKAEEALEWSMKLLNETGQMAHIGGWEIDLLKNELSWTDEVRRIHEVPMDFQPNIATAIDFYSPVSQPAISAAVNELIEQGAPFDLVLEIITAKGNLRWVHALGKGIFLEGKIIKVSGTFQDVTERKHAELALAAEKERLAVTLRSIGDGVITTDPDGKITMLNKAAEVMAGWGSEEATGLPLTEVFNIINEFTRKQCKSPVDELIAADSITELQNHTILIAKDGKEIIITYNGAPLRDNENKVIGVVLVFRDMTEELNAIKQKEALTEQLHQSRKMEAIGQLAGGIAHDFNNSLGGIIGAAELIKHGTFDKAKQEKFIDLIITAADRAGELTKKLLMFSRKGNKVSSSVDINDIIINTIDILGHTLDRNISISTTNDATNSLIVGDDSLLQNAIMNIAINASHAMPDGGEIEFTSKNIKLDSEYCTASPFELEPGDYLEITIRDTGCGMTPEVQSHIFEPFFSTKEQGKGTGLGLATVYGTILDHFGAITVYSEVNTGTVFHLYLPTTKTTSNTIEQETVISGTGTVLVIDDEELIRITAGVLLESLGYEVICAENGQKGVEVFSEKHNEIDLIILDMIMPVMGGREAFLKLREINPKIPVIISSGFAKESDMKVLTEQGTSGSIHKPTYRAELANIVANALK